MNCQLATPLHPSFTDFTITVDGQDFQLHKAVLAAASPVFERMLLSSMQEGMVRSRPVCFPQSCAAGWVAIA